MRYLVSDLSHYCNVSITSSTIPSRVISYYDLSFVLKGSMTYYINGEAYELGENDAILLPPGTLRERLAGEQRVDFVSFNFQIAEGEKIDLPLFMNNVITQEIRDLVGVFPQKHLSDLYHSKEKLCCLLNYILLELMEARSFQTNHPDVLRIIKFVDENLTLHITLEMLSRQVHRSREYLCALFKKNVGKTLIEYVNERKMLLAKQMIEEGGMPLKDVAANLGYEHYGYFSRVFKRYFGDPPLAMKKRKQ